MSSPYRKLPGKGLRSDGGVVASHYATSRLWLAEDHLLLVEQIYCNQTVRRFYLKDIQSISLCRTSRYAIYNAVAGLLLLFGGMPALFGDEIGWRIFGAIFGSIGLILLLFNLFKGPTTRAHLQTAVHRVELPSFKRLRNAQKALALIVPAIEAAQGRLEPGELQDAVAAATGPSVRADLNPAVTGVAAGVRERTRRETSTNKWHRALYPLLLAEGALSLATIAFNNLFTVLLGSALFLLAGFLSAMAIARQDTPLVSRRLRSLTKLSIGYVILAFAVG